MTWVNTSQQLEILCQCWSRQSVIAVDTEFERSKTFYPILALLQVADAIHTQDQFCVDTLAIPQTPEWFGEVLRADATKVLHAGQEDIEIFSYWSSNKASDVTLKGIFDTQIAAAYNGLGAQISYQSLVKQLLDIDLDKTQTRTNWLQRPLTDEQLLYAANDVKYLLPCYELLCEQLQKKNRLAWVLEDCQQLARTPSHPVNLEDYYLTLSSGWFFDIRQRAVLKALCAWREKYIRQHNIPRSFVAKDGYLLAIAEQLPSTPTQLRKFLDYKSRDLSIESPMLEVMEEALAAVQQGYIPAAILQPVTMQKKFKPILQHLKSAASDIAQQFNLPDGLVLRQRWLEKLISEWLLGSSSERRLQLPEMLQGWRYEAVVEPLERVFRKALK